MNEKEKLKKLENFDLSKFQVIDFNNYLACEDMFPEWKDGCRSKLNKFCDNTDGWIVEFRGNFSIATLDFPKVRNTKDNKFYPAFLVFPKKERHQVVAIIEKLLKDYLPSMAGFNDRTKDVSLVSDIQKAIEAKQLRLIENGKRPILEELRFRLGVLEPLS